MSDEVEKLAEEYAAIEIVYFKHPKVAYDTIGTYETGKAYLSKESAEALAHVALARDAKLRAAVRQYVKQNCAYIPESYPSVCRHLTDCETCNRKNFAKLLGEEPPRKALEFGEEREKDSGEETAQIETAYLKELPDPGTAVVIAIAGVFAVVFITAAILYFIR